MNFIKVAWEDISSIFKNRFMRVSVIAIIIVPLLYSMLYLAAFWDPYSKLKNMPVAVVNSDTGVMKGGERVNYGDDVVKKLKGNAQVGWKFVSKSEAEKGVKGKKYYSAFFIPENFSENIMSAKDRKPEEAKILYKSNNKTNFLASQINGKVQLELKDQVARNIIDEYTKQTFDNLYEVKDGFAKAADGSKQLKDGLVTAHDGTTQLKDGLGLLNGKIPEMKDGVGKLADGSLQLKNGLGDLQGQVPTMASGVSKLSDGANGLNNGLTKLNGSVPTMVAGVTKLNQGFEKKILPSTKQLKDGAKGLSIGLSSAQGVADKLNAGAAELDKGYKLMTPSLQNLTIGSAQVAGGVDSLIDKTATTQTALQAAGLQLQTYIGTHPEAKNDSNMQNVLNILAGIKLEASKPENAILIQKLKIGSHGVADGMNQLSDGTGAFVAGAGKFSQGATAFATGTSKTIVGSKKLSEGLDALYAGMTTEFGPGLNQLNANMPELSSGVIKLGNGSGQVAGGLNQLNDKMPALAGGASKLYDGSLQLNNGLSTLNGKMPELIDGATKLVDGSVKLDDGVVKLSDGSKELNDKLTEGSNKMNKNLINSSKDMGKFVSEPVVMDEKPLNEVKNYGTGFTPYFIPLSLWVGAIMMFFIVTDKVDDKIKASSSSIVAGKFLSYGFIGILQAVLVSTVVMMLGLKPNNIPLYFIFNIFMSYVFIAIIQCLIFLLGQVGRLLSIVLLILQLTACAGTFPIEVVPNFFKVINPFMPFTYCVSSLREIISGSDYAVISQNVGILAATMFVFLFISIIMKGHADKVQAIIEQRKEDAAAKIA